MTTKLLILLSILWLNIISISSSQAAEALCKSNAANNPYCKYEGKITQIYINSDNLLLIFFEKEILPVDAKKYGFTIKNGQAVAFRLTDETASLFSTIVELSQTALVNELPVSIHMRGVEAGYMKFDRMWISGKSSIF